MIPSPQIELLKRLLSAHAHAWAEGQFDYGLVEVGWINGVNPRTAKALTDAGLAEYDVPRGYEPRPEISFIRLPVPLPQEDPEKWERYGRGE